MEDAIAVCGCALVTPFTAVFENVTNRYSLAEVAALG
jgi:hypothetical protein